MRLRTIPCVVGLALLGAMTAAFAGTDTSIADTAFDAPGNSNPIVPGYFADPTIKKFGDTYYLYATTDGNGGTCPARPSCART
jgi:hypothetical protein